MTQPTHEQVCEFFDYYGDYEIRLNAAYGVTDPISVESLYQHFRVRLYREIADEMAAAFKAHGVDITRSSP